MYYIMYFIIIYVCMQSIWLFLVKRYDYSMDDLVVDHLFSKIVVQYNIPFQMDFYKYLKSRGKIFP